jgi:hypothetical protein
VYVLRITENVSQATYNYLVAASVPLHRNKFVLPVAAWIAQNRPETVAQPAVNLGLQGRAPANKIIEALERLDKIGALEEMPQLGERGKRVFVVTDSSYWDFVRSYSREVTAASGRMDGNQG